MTILSLTVVALLSADVPLPPPPPGMVERKAADTVAPAVPGENEEETGELEEMRANEAAALDPHAYSDAARRSSLSQLGYGGLRDRLERALIDADFGAEELPFQLPPVTNLSTFDVSVVKDRYDIPIEMQPLVMQYIHYFQGPGRKWFRRWMGRSARYIPLMQPILEERGLPVDLVYLAMIESGFSATAYSWAAASGPWQFIAGTGRMYGLKQDFWVDERRDPVKSTHAAAQYLRQLYSEFGHWYLAWAGYNTGGGRVKRMINSYSTRDFWELSERKGFATETKHYVPKLIACALIAKHPEAFGFRPDEFEYEAPFDYDEYKLTSAVDFEVLARAAETDVETLQTLNPELKRWCTPPATTASPYVIRIPKGSLARFADNLSKISPSERLNFRVHRVKKGDTLSSIALAYKSAPEAIMRMNGLRSSRALRVRSELVVPVPSARSQKEGLADSALARQVARARRAGIQAARPEEEIPAGTLTTKRAPSGSVKTEQVNGKTRVTYGVAAGDSLWSISTRFDCSVASLREWNRHLARSNRSLRLGTMLTIWPGPKAKLEAAAAPQKSTEHPTVANNREGRRVSQ